MKNKNQDISDDYFEFMLNRALNEYSEEEGQKYLNGLDSLDEPEYSLNYKKQIKRLMLKGNKSKKVSLRLQRIAAALLIVVLSGSTVMYNVDADLRSFINSLFTKGDTQVDISINSTSLNYDFSDIPVEWEYFYVPDYLPAGYRVSDIYATNFSINIVYSCGESKIIYIEGKSYDPSLSIDREHPGFKDVKTNKLDGYFINKANTSSLIWEFDEQFFQLNGPIDEKELIKIAESLILIDM